MDLEKLEELGLTKGQISVYTAVLDSGIATINKIQEKSGLERRGIYDILNKLIEKGLITYTIERGKKTYKCTHPNKILEEIKKKQEKLEELKKQIPNVISLFKESKSEIRAEIFRGTEAMKALLEDALSCKETYWIGGNARVEGTPLKAWWKHWMQRRVKQKKMMYDLVDYGTCLEDIKPATDIKKHKKLYVKYCTLPKKLSSPLVILIYGDKVAQILWKNKPFAFVLESKEIKDSFMRYFHYFWKDPW